MAEEFRIIARAAGGPEVMVREPIGDLAPGEGEVLIRHRAIGVNYADTYIRSGLYPSAFPAGLGGEAAGVIEAVGSGVAGFTAGDRVAYGTGGQGAYATLAVRKAEHVFILPDAIDFDLAAAAMLKGMTAAYLIGPCGQVQAGQWVLVHSAAGGVGAILVQWLRHLGARVIAHVGSAQKAARVAALGPDHVLSCPFDALAEEVRRLTDGAGVQVVLDGVGADSWRASLQSLTRRGLLVTYGNASGPVPPFTALDLTAAGSVFVTRPTLIDYARTVAERKALADAVFARIVDGSVTVEIGQRFDLADAAEAHRALQGRRTIGSTVLVPPAG